MSWCFIDDILESGIVEWRLDVGIKNHQKIKIELIYHNWSALALYLLWN